MSKAANKKKNSDRKPRIWQYRFPGHTSIIGETRQTHASRSSVIKKELLPLYGNELPSGMKVWPKPAVA